MTRGAPWRWAVIVLAAALLPETLASQERVQTCGLEGTVAARINSCAAIFGQELTTRKVEPVPLSGAFTTMDESAPRVWRLVTRTITKHLVWQDESTNLLWVFAGAFNLYTEAERACSRFTIGLGLRWKIPTPSTLAVARGHKLFDVLNQPGDYLAYVSQTSPERTAISYVPPKYAACVGRQG